MRARLTIIGFNIAVVSFQLSQSSHIPGGIKVEGVSHAIHACSQASLLLAIAISMASAIAYLYSSEYDQVGTCRSSSLIMGDILMYLGLALTISGFFSQLESSMHALSASNMGNSQSFINLHTSLRWTGAVSWFCAAYLAPIHALKKSPFPKNINQRLAAFYIILLCALSFISANAVAIDQGIVSGNTFMQWLTEFVQPIRW